MKKPLYVKIIILLLIVIESSFIFLSIKSFNNKEAHITKEKEVTTVRPKNFSMYLKNSSGEYEEITDTSIFNSSYTLNTEKTICVDKSSNAVDVIPVFNNGKITVTAGTTVYCTLYFDYDTEGPVFTRFVNPTNGDWTNDDYDLDIDGTDDSGVQGYCYNTEGCNGTFATTYALNSASWSVADNATLRQSIYVKLKDTEGNYSAECKTTDIKIDKVVPTATISANNGSTVSISCTDDVGVVAYYFGTTRPDSNSTYTSIISTTNYSTTKTATESTTYYLACKDASGNIDLTSTEVCQNIHYNACGVSNTLLQPNDSNYAGIYKYQQTCYYTDNSNHTCSNVSCTPQDCTLELTRPTGYGQAVIRATKTSFSHSDWSNAAGEFNENDTFYAIGATSTQSVMFGYCNTTKNGAASTTCKHWSNSNYPSTYGNVTGKMYGFSIAGCFTEFYGGCAETPNETANASVVYSKQTNTCTEVINRPFTVNSTLRGVCMTDGDGICTSTGLSVEGEAQKVCANAGFSSYYKIMYKGQVNAYTSCYTYGSCPSGYTLVSATNKCQKTTSC